MSFKTNEEAEFDFAISQADQTIDRLIKERTKQDARIAELTAELARYKAALEKIASARTNGLPAIHTSDTPRIARNALKEGVS